MRNGATNSSEAVAAAPAGCLPTYPGPDRSRWPPPVSEAGKAARGRSADFEALKARDAGHPRGRSQRLGFQSRTWRRPESWSNAWAPTRSGSPRAGTTGALGRRGGMVSVNDLDAMIADNSEVAVWRSRMRESKATPPRPWDRRAADLDQGENVNGLIDGLVSAAARSLHGAAAPGLAEGVRVKRGRIPTGRMQSTRLSNRSRACATPTSRDCAAHGVPCRARAVVPRQAITATASHPWR